MIATPLPVAGMPLDGLGVLRLSNGETGDHPLNSPGAVVVGFHTDDKDARSVPHQQFASLLTCPR